MRAMMLTALVGLVLVGGEVAPELAKLRETYAAAQAKIEGDRAKAVEKAVAGYEGELRALLANVRQQGDLDYVTAVQGELKRLETDRTAPAEPAAKRMKHLRASQWGTRQAQDKADKERGERLAKLAGEYAALLAGLEKQLVADNRIADAKMTREEREAVLSTTTEQTKPKEEPTVLKAYIDGDTDLVLEDGKVCWVVPANRTLVGYHSKDRTDPVYVDDGRWLPEWHRRKDGAWESKPLRIAKVRADARITYHPKLEPGKVIETTGPVVRIPDPERGPHWYFFTIH